MHHQSLNARASVNQEYPLSAVPIGQHSPNNNNIELDHIIQDMKTRIQIASQLTNLHPLFRTTAPIQTPQQQHPSEPLNDVESATDIKRVSHRSGRLTCLLVGRLWSQDSEALEGLVDVSGSKPGDEKHLLSSPGLTVVVGFISCNIELAPFTDTDATGTLHFSVTFRSRDREISGRCASSLLFSLNEALIGRLASL